MSASATIPTISEYRELILADGVADHISDMVLVDGYLYGITATSPAKIIRIAKSNFAYAVSTFANDGNHINASDIIYVPSQNKLYVAFPISGRLLITEVDPVTLAMTDRVNEVTASASTVSMATDDAFLYVLMATVGNVLTLRQYDFAFAGHADPTLTNILGADGLVFHGTGVYFIGWPSGSEPTPRIYRVDTSDLSVTSAAITPLGGNIRRLHHAVVLSGKLFFCSEEVSNKIVVISLDTLTSQLLDFSASGDHSALVSDGTFIWNLRDNGLALRIDPSTLEIEVYTLNPGDGYLSELEGDGTYLYASFFQVGTKIARYHIAHTASASPQLVGFLPAVGVANDVVISGNYAFLASRAFGLMVINVSNPAAPALVSTVDHPFDGSKVAVSGSVACVTGSRTAHSSPGVASYVGVFYVINITDPARPLLIGSIEDSGYFYGVAISGNYAYVGRGFDGVSIIDISNRSQPTIVGSYNTLGAALSVSVVGNYAYVADGQAGGLRILDISNPTIPLSVGWVDTPGNAYGVTVVGAMAYVADLQDFQVVDVSNPAAPSLRGGLAIAAVDVKLQSNIAYVAAVSTGLKAVNVSNPDSLSQTGTIAAFGANSPITNGVFAVGNLAYLANGEGGLGIANISNPAAMAQVSSLRTWFSTSKLAIKTGLAILSGYYLSNGGLNSVGGLRIINITNPAAPSAVGALDDPSLTFYGVAVSGNYVYAACGLDGIKVIDITNPAAPAIVGSYDTPGGGQSVTVVGNLAYVADGQAGGLRILDVSNPTAPTSVGWIDTPGNAQDVAVVGQLAYVADFYGLQIVNVSNPSSPSLSGSLSVSAFQVQIRKGVAYVAGGNSGLIAVDVSNPSIPRRLGSIAPVGAFSPTTASIALNGPTAYVANGAGGLAIIDVSNPDSLRLISTAPTLGYASSVAVSGRWAYLADSLAGINIFDVG